MKVNLAPVLAVLSLSLSSLAMAETTAIPIQVGGNFTSINMPYVSVTICLPGTETCQTIPEIRLDTGSTGLRLKATVVTLPYTPETDPFSGASVGECWRYGGGEVLWGPVVQADIVLGNETASSVPIQMVNSDFASTPADCTHLNMSSAENGVLGIGVSVDDTGQGTVPNTSYYLCTGSDCTASSIAENLQLQNPVSMMPIDNNGVTITFPAVPENGSASVTGSMILGVGTNSQNQPQASATILHTDAVGWFRALFQGNTYDTMMDSGTPPINLPSAFNGATTCAAAYGWENNWLCPATPLNFSVTWQSWNTMSGSTSNSTLASTSIPFELENSGILLNNGNRAFYNVGYQSGGLISNTFILGMSFFYGKTIYFGMDTKDTPLGKGPLVAF